MHVRLEHPSKTIMKRDAIICFIMFQLHWLPRTHRDDVLAAVLCVIELL